MGSVPTVARTPADVLSPGGLFAFTVETHDSDGVELGERLR
jgi:predicted TPR repeat methyltransferase